MSRALVPALVALLGVLGWVTIPERLLLSGDDAGAQLRERLFVELRDAQAVHLKLPAGTERVELQAVAAVSMKLPYDPADRYYFGFEAGFETGGSPSAMRDVSLNSRVSIREDPFSRTALRGARLLVGSEDLTDVRLFVLDVPEPFRSRGGLLRLRVQDNTAAYLLLRAFAHRSAPQGVEQYASLSPASFERRQVLAAAGTNLSEFDVEQALWEKAVQAPVERMPPIGVRGKDYITRRVVLSHYRRPFQDARSDQSAGLDCGPERWLALNLRGTVSLRFAGEARTQVRVQEFVSEGSDRVQPTFRGESMLVLDEDGNSERSVHEAEADEDRTLVVSCPRATTMVRVFTDLKGLEARLGEIRPGSEVGVLPRGSLGYPLRPDFRRVRFLALREGDPVEYDSVLESRVRLELRDRVAPTLRDKAPSVDVEVLVNQETVARQQHRVSTRVSTFERTVAGELLTDRYYVELDLPAGARLRVSGGQGTLVRLSHLVPEVRDVYALDYRNSGQGKRWRYAPRDLDRWAAVAPRRSSHWRALDAFVTVAEQVRLVDGVTLRPVADAGRRRHNKRLGVSEGPEATLERGSEAPRPTDERGGEAGTLGVPAVAGDPAVGEASVDVRAHANATLPTGEGLGPAHRETTEPSNAVNRDASRSSRSQGGRFRPGPRYTRSVRPTGSPRSHRVFVQRALAAGRAPRTALTALEGPRDVWVVPGAAPHRLLIRPDPDLLGQPLTILIDGVPTRQIQVRTTAQFVPFALQSGVYRIEVRGLGARGMAYATGLPASGLVTHQRRYYRLADDAPLRFRFSVAAEERQVLLLQVLSEASAPTCFRTRVTLERLDPTLPREEVLERHGCTHRSEEVLFWDLGARRTTLATQVRVPMARVRGETTREVQLELLPMDAPLPTGTAEGREVYLRALVIGDVVPDESNEIRFRRLRRR